MVSLCILATHSEGAVPENVFSLAREIFRHFDRVIVSTTTMDSVSAVRGAVPGVETHVSPNDSYDIGLFYKAWAALPLSDREAVTRLGFVNDSNILLCRLDNVFAWGEVNSAGFWGLTDNIEIQYHIQTPFLVFEKRAIPILEEFFDLCGVATQWPLIKNKHVLRETVINEFEVKLTGFMTSKNITTAVYTPCVALGFRNNVSILNPRALLAVGHPVIKRQVAKGIKGGEIVGEDVSRARAFRYTYRN